MRSMVYSADVCESFRRSLCSITMPRNSNYYIKQRGGNYGSGSGRYSVILTKEANEDSSLERLNKLPQLAGLVTINRMLLPERLESDREIRGAASRLQADLVLLYTFNTAFFDADVAKPFDCINAGLSTRKISAATTVSALLMDTRTGYIYSAYDVTERAQTFATSWGSRETAGEARRKNEEGAFRKLIDKMEISWPKLLERHAKKS